jgi:hypothetical protein
MAGLDIRKLLGTHFQGHFSWAWPWQMENVKIIFEGTTAIGLGAMVYV